MQRGSDTAEQEEAEDNWGLLPLRPPLNPLFGGWTQKNNQLLYSIQLGEQDCVISSLQAREGGKAGMTVIPVLGIGN